MRTAHLVHRAGRAAEAHGGGGAYASWVCGKPARRGSVWVSGSGAGRAAHRQGLRGAAARGGIRKGLTRGVHVGRGVGVRAGGHGVRRVRGVGRRDDVGARAGGGDVHVRVGCGVVRRRRCRL